MTVLLIVLGVLFVIAGAVLIRRRPGGWNLFAGVALIVVGLVVAVPPLLAL